MISQEVYKSRRDRKDSFLNRTIILNSVVVTAYQMVGDVNIVHHRAHSCFLGGKLILCKPGYRGTLSVKCNTCTICIRSIHYNEEKDKNSLKDR